MVLTGQIMYLEGEKQLITLSATNTVSKLNLGVLHKNAERKGASSNAAHHCKKVIYLCILNILLLGIILPITITFDICSRNMDTFLVALKMLLVETISIKEIVTFAQVTLLLLTI